MSKLWIIIALMGLYTGVTLAEGRSFGKGADEFLPYGFQRMWRWAQLRKTYCGERDFMAPMMQSLEDRKCSYLICPWWLEDLYDDPLVAGYCRQGIGYVGYVLNPSTGMPRLTNEWRNKGADGILNDSIYLHVPYDLVVFCRGGEAFDGFLLSPEARLNFLHQVFDWPGGAINQKHLGKRPRGIHFFLPDFTFREKRAFTQFIKSVSMVIDSMTVERGRRPYAGDQCMFYITFPTGAYEELNFLSGIAVFVDDIYFADYDEYGAPVQVLPALNIHTDTSPLWTKLLNQFYLLRWKHYCKKSEADPSDIDYLADADYDNFQWETYLFLEVIWLAAFVVLIFLYNFYSPFYMFTDRNRWLVAPVVITFVTEGIILFLFVLEAISKDVVLFSMEQQQHLWLLALPLLFIVLNVLFRLLGRSKYMP